jgi:hypothetical protein
MECAGRRLLSPAAEGKGERDTRDLQGGKEKQPRAKATQAIA